LAVLFGYEDYAVESISWVISVDEVITQQPARYAHFFPLGLGIRII
jgi:hypothetical protein